MAESLPEWACEPTAGNAESRFEAYKGEEAVGTYLIGTKVSSIFGRDRELNDFVLSNPSISRQHAMILHDDQGGIYVMDLDSRHGTFLNEKRLIPHEAVLLHENVRITFGQSSRSYKLLNVDKKGTSAAIKSVKTWKFTKMSTPKMPKMTRKRSGGNPQGKMVHSILSTHVSIEEMKNFVHHVSILPVESQEKIVVLLMDRIKAKFGLKTVSTQKQALQAIAQLIVGHVAIAHIEPHVYIISNVSQGRNDSENRALARQILQSLAELQVESDSKPQATPLESQSSYVEPNVPTPSYAAPNVPTASYTAPRIPTHATSPKANGTLHRSASGSKSPPTPVQYNRPEPISTTSLSPRHASSSPSPSRFGKQSLPQKQMERQRAISAEGKKLFIQTVSPRRGAPILRSPTREREGVHERNASPNVRSVGSTNRYPPNGRNASPNIRSVGSTIRHSPNIRSGGPTNRYSPNGRSRQDSTTSPEISGFNFIQNSNSLPSPPAQVPVPVPSAPSIPLDFLREEPDFDPTNFESLWASTVTSEEWTMELNGELCENELENLLEEYCIKCIASGQVGSIKKFFFYAEQASNGTVFMLEMNVTESVRHLSGTCKWGEMALLYDSGHVLFLQLIQQILTPLKKQVILESLSTEIISDTVSLRCDRTGVYIDLKASPFVQPSSFEHTWINAMLIDELSDHFDNLQVVETLETYLITLGFVCLASGTVQEVQKFYFYTETKHLPLLFLLEMSLDLQDETFEGIVKLSCEDTLLNSPDVEAASSTFLTCLKSKLLNELDE